MSRAILFPGICSSFSGLLHLYNIFVFCRKSLSKAVPFRALKDLPLLVALKDLFEVMATSMSYQTQFQCSDRRMYEAELVQTLALLSEAVQQAKRQRLGTPTMLVVSDTIAPDKPRSTFLTQRWLPLTLTIHCERPRAKTPLCLLYKRPHRLDLISSSIVRYTWTAYLFATSHHLHSACGLVHAYFSIAATPSHHVEQAVSNDYPCSIKRRQDMLYATRV